jgi:hypothetical protein
MPKLYEVIDTIESNIRRLNVVASDDIDHDLKDKILNEISVLDFIHSMIIENTTRIMVIAGDPKLVSPLIEAVSGLPKEDVTNDLDSEYLTLASESGSLHSMIVIDPTDKIMELCREAYQFDREDAGNLPRDILLDDISCNAYYLAHLSNTTAKVIIMNFNVRGGFVDDISRLSEWTKLIFEHLNTKGSGQK